MTYETRILLKEGIEWGEGARWYGDKLFFSDIYGKKVMSVDLNGKSEIVANVPGMPSGLGFLPDGRLLIVSGMDGTLYVNGSNGLTAYACIYKGLAEAKGINDMVVDTKGNAYVGTYGFDITQYKGGPAEGWITLVTPDGKMRVAGGGMMCPNGIVITPDGKTLIAADTFTKQLIAYTIESDGSLTGCHVWAQLDSGPDGIAMDAEGFVWAATPNANEVIRVKEGGEITDRVKMSNTPLTCALGGPERRKLFVVTVAAHDTGSTEALSDPSKAQNKRSYIEVTDVKVPGGGCP